MKKCVLVADYNNIVRDELVAALRASGYQAIPVSTGAELVEHIRLVPPDLLVWSTRMEMDTFKSIDPWSPRSLVAAIPRIRIGVPSPNSEENGRLVRLTPSHPPLLMGKQPMPITTVLEAVRSILPLE